MNIRLDLAHHCIETAIKRRYNAAISSYFKTRDRQGGLEEKIVLLEAALAAFDFNRLRSQWPPLAGHSDTCVMLNRGPAGQPTLVFDHLSITPPADPV